VKQQCTRNMRVNVQRRCQNVQLRNTLWLHQVALQDTEGVCKSSTVQLAGMHSLHGCAGLVMCCAEMLTLASASEAATTGDDKMRFDASVCSIESRSKNSRFNAGALLSCRR
jgi:hypothetical protein